MRDLGKWPRLLVTGPPVSPRHADEILVRTNMWYMSSNNQDWNRVVAELAGISIGNHGLYDHDSLRRFERRHQVLQLSYLHNWRISSSWLGGPHGWCDWDGSIGCSTHNIGTWPTVEEVTADWTVIAEAFPWLELTAQLVGEESAAGEPAVQWDVRGGRVTTDTEPVRLVRPVDDFDMKRAVMAIAYDPFYEQGVRRERLELALEYTRRDVVVGEEEPGLSEDT